MPVDVPIDVPLDVPLDVADDGPCTDNDHDGWTTCDGDCDDNNPLVNPGAYDFPNGIDDDCDGQIDNAVTDCGEGLQYTSQTPRDYALAIEICQDTMLVEPLPQRRWGLIGSQLLLADGTGAPAPDAHSIIPSFGNVLLPRKNSNMASFSTGEAATPAQAYYTASTPQPGTQNLPGAYTLAAGLPHQRERVRGAARTTPTIR